MVPNKLRRIFTPGQPGVPRVIAPKHTRAPGKRVADPAHPGMNRSFLDIERLRRLAEIEMNRIIATALPGSLVGARQNIICGTLETRHEHRPADALKRCNHS